MIYFFYRLNNLYYLRSARERLRILALKKLQANFNKSHLREICDDKINLIQNLKSVHNNMKDWMRWFKSNFKNKYPQLFIS